MKPIYAYLLLFSAFLCAPIFSNAQCAAGEIKLTFQIDADGEYYDNAWVIYDGNGDVFDFDYLVDDALSTTTMCLPNAPCYSFLVYDFSANGFSLGGGSIKVFVNDILVGENVTGFFDQFWEVKINCPVGAACGTASEVVLGNYSAPNPNYWYKFTPADTGTFKLSTCNLGNNCDTKIWIYNRCAADMLISEDQLGAIFYNNDACDSLTSEAILYLAGDKDYYFRIGDNSSNCEGQTINWSIEYLGAVVGCTDPTACNYNPLATISDSVCIYPGDVACVDGPDLVVVRTEIVNSLYVGPYNNQDNCAVEEGCVKGYGDRWLLNFSTWIKNIGTKDYLIGAPPTDPTELSNQFEFDECHQHWHYKGYADYLLYDEANNKFPVGSKNGFCVLDLECDNGGYGQFSCDYMGITAGCGDIYSTGLPCQWVDITDVPEGKYTLVVRVNWDKSPDATGKLELDYDNNLAAVCIQIDKNSQNQPIVSLINDCLPVVDCVGIPFGDAELDCEAVCNGAALHGDWNKDANRDSTDIVEYLKAAVDPAAATNSCKDLHFDQKLDIFDAALLQECALHGDNSGYWEARFPCEFPTGISNPDDIMYLLPGELNETAKYFDVQIVNPFHQVVGMQFRVKGLKINQLELLDPSFEAHAEFNSVTGEIVVLTMNESFLSKNILTKKWLRIYYSQLTEPAVCLENVQIINNKYERAEALLPTPACANSSTATIDFGQTFGAFVHPNPARANATLVFSNPNFEPTTVELFDAQGRRVRFFDGIREEQMVISRGNLPAGFYAYRISGRLGAASGRLIFE